MKIEIAEPGRMKPTGSSLLRLIQNNSMPFLDLLVREAIQNSLDAADEESDYVSVDLITGSFNSKELSKELEGITDSLNKKYPADKYEFIAIADSNTVGLTGKLHHDDVTGNDYGNLIKLVYDICKPQNNEGAGGSWGLGKTVYFRIGIGLVIYYSRIVNENGCYESRLAASLVENEMNEDSLIPVINGELKTGIAWWGEEIQNNKTIPIRDEKYIKKILSIFNIEPYEGTKTGTVIIIPYINSDELLKNNQAEYLDNEGKQIWPYWCYKLDDYLVVAVQRWYAPRLNNAYYPYGKWLRVRINNRCLTYDSMEPVFQIIQGLYNRAVNKKTEYYDILHKHDIKIGSIRLNRILNDPEAGVVAFTKVNRNMLKMCPPDNKHSPYMYFNCGITESERNRPVVTFTRKPGMLISYETTGHWADTIEETNSNEFVIGIFVLNSKNSIPEIGISLEEYIRRSEMAAHNSWNDFTVNSVNPRIVSRIQKHVKNKISKEYFGMDDLDDWTKIRSGLSKLLGDLLLPPENFGRRASGNSVRENDNTIRRRIIENHKDITLTVIEDSIRYTFQGIEIPLMLKTKSAIKKAVIMIGIESETGNITASEWEKDLGINLPFDIEAIDVSFIILNKSDFKYLNDFIVNKSSPDKEINGLKLSLLTSERGSSYGFIIKSEQKLSYEMKLTVKLNLRNRNIRTILNVEASEGES